MPTREEKFKAFKALHERPGIFLIPNPWSAGTAKILTALGFEALATTSAGYAFSVGSIDSNAAITLDGVLQNAKAIVDATFLPVSADLQDGFGSSPGACAETVRAPRRWGLRAARSKTLPATKTIRSMSSIWRSSAWAPRQKLRMILTLF